LSIFETSHQSLPLGQLNCFCFNYHEAESPRLHRNVSSGDQMIFFHWTCRSLLTVPTVYQFMNGRSTILR
jgi:hypothetical protein